MLAFSGNGVPSQTQTAGTLIVQLIPPHREGVTRITKAVYTAAATAHTMTIARAIGRTTASSAAASGQAVINLTADPNTSVGGSNAIAANDILAIRETDGVTRKYVVSSVSTLAITLTTNLTAGAASGADVWSFGVLGDTDPRSGAAHPTLTLPASATTTYEDREAGVMASFARDEPLWVSINNATNAGTLVQLSYAYTIN